MKYPEISKKTHPNETFPTYHGFSVRYKWHKIFLRRLHEMSRNAKITHLKNPAHLPLGQCWWYNFFRKLYEVATKSKKMCPIDTTFPAMGLILSVNGIQETQETA